MTAASVTRRFELLETFRWTPDEGFFLLHRHLERLEASARFAEYPCPLDRVCAALDRAVAGAAQPLRVRLMVDNHGEPRTDIAPLEPMPAPVRAALAAHPVDSRSPFLFHKTTHREHLERERRSGFDDTVLWNQHGEVTETIIANLVVQIDALKVTPPVAAGLLPGTMRAELLARGEIVERSVRVDELRGAPRFWLINSVRGWMDAVLAG